MCCALIIGYGNPLRGDDGFGWHVADRLTELLNDESAKILAVHQLTPELAESIGEAKLVIFVDAAYGGEPGSWKCEPVASDTILSNALTHYSPRRDCSLTPRRSTRPNRRRWHCP